MDPSAHVSRETPPATVLEHPELSAFHDLLATAGVDRGLLGPREIPRLWDRHILNCAVVETLIPPGSTVADVGSGAGLPGLVLAIVRPDIRVELVEPLARRCTFLEEAVAQLGLSERVSVHRSRAEDLTGRRFDVVTARAVAPLERLAGWCLPLVRPGGQLLAIKGSKAEEELDQARSHLPRGAEARIEQCGVGIVDPPTTVVVIHVTGSGA